MDAVHVRSTLARRGSRPYRRRHVNETTEPRSLRLGLEAEPPLRDVARRIADDLAERLRARFPDIAWTVEVLDGELKDPQARIAELIKEARETMLERGIDLAV